MSRPISDAVDAVDPGRVIDPTNLSPLQRAGARCAYTNCFRWLSDSKVFLGSMPDGSPVFVCDDHEAVEQ